MKLIVATQNQHKKKEILSLLGDSFEIISLSDLNYFDELSEAHSTLRENADEKATFVNNYFQADCFAEDTGLEIDHLNGVPGVLSARYAGDQKNSRDNTELVIKTMEGVKNRSARFRTVICLILDNKKFFFEGNVNGMISSYPQGDSGFGYDAIFIPEGFQKTYAQMNFAEKNDISHRKNALEKMKAFLLSGQTVKQ